MCIHGGLLFHPSFLVHGGNTKHVGFAATLGLICFAVFFILCSHWIRLMFSFSLRKSFDRGCDNRRRASLLISRKLFSFNYANRLFLARSFLCQSKLSTSVDQKKGHEMTLSRLLFVVEAMLRCPHELKQDRDGELSRAQS